MPSLNVAPGSSENIVIRDGMWGGSASGIAPLMEDTFEIVLKFDVPKRVMLGIERGTPVEVDLPTAHAGDLPRDAIVRLVALDRFGHRRKLFFERPYGEFSGVTDWYEYPETGEPLRVAEDSSLALEVSSPEAVNLNLDDASLQIGRPGRDSKTPVVAYHDSREGVSLDSSSGVMGRSSSEMRGRVRQARPVSSSDSTMEVPSSSEASDGAVSGSSASTTDDPHPTEGHYARAAGALVAAVRAPGVLARRAHERVEAWREETLPVEDARDVYEPAFAGDVRGRPPLGELEEWWREQQAGERAAETAS